MKRSHGIYTAVSALLIVVTLFFPFAGLAQESTPITEDNPPAATESPMEQVDPAQEPPLEVSPTEVATPDDGDGLLPESEESNTVHPQSVGPSILVNGETEDIIAGPGLSVTVDTTNDTEWATFASAGCGGSPLSSWTTGTGSFQTPTSGVVSVRGRDKIEPSNLGDCINVTIVANPTISVDGQTVRVTVPLGTNVSPDLPMGAYWMAFTGANCTGNMMAPDWLEPYNVISSATQQTFWLQGRWGSNDATRGNCLEVNWRQGKPSMQVGGKTGTIYIRTGTTATPLATSGSEVGQFNAADCSGNPLGGWKTGSLGQFTNGGDTVASFQARWPGEESTRGNCVTVYWVSAPTLTVEGHSSDFIVDLNVSVTPAFSSGSQWSYFSSADCSGTPATNWSTTATPVSSSDVQTFSFQARLTAATEIVSACIKVTWRPDKPTLTVEGKTGEFNVVTGYEVHISVPEGAESTIFSSNDCTSINPSGWYDNPSYVISKSDGTVSFQARWSGEDSTRGNCVTVTWEPVGQPVLASAVCGDNNDVITSPKSQPGIAVSDSGWIDNERTIELSEVDGYSFPLDQQTVFKFSDTGPCDTTAPAPPTQTATCGVDNDTVAIPDQPEHVVVNQSSSSWSDDHTWTVTFSAAEGYKLPDGTKTEYVFTDEGLCQTDSPAPPTLSATCGIDNDTVMVPDQPEHVVVTQSNAWSNDHTWTVTFSAAENYQLPDGIKTEYVFTDEGLCQTDSPVAPTQTAACGVDNDTVMVPDQPEHVVMTQSNAWSNDHTWTVTFSAAENYKLPDGTKTEYVFTDAGLCETDSPAPPTLSATCGIDNDTVVIPDQPEHVVMTQSSSWSNDHTWTVTFSAAENYQLPAGTKTEYVFTDAGLCQTDSPVAPTQTAVCGVDNDTVVIPDQPANVKVTQSSSWSDDHTWTVTFSAAENYQLPDGTKTEYVFTDEGLCLTQPPVVPTQAAACGVDNDTIAIPDQPEHVVVTQSSGWSDDHTWTVTFSAAENYQLPDGTKTEYVFTDAGLCQTDSPVSPTQAAACGVDNDTVVIPDQPANVNVTQSSSWSDDHTWTVTLSAAEGYRLPDGAQTEYVFTDEGPCQTLPPVPPVQTEVCGSNNDIVQLEDQPENVVATQSENWSDDHTWTVTFTAAENYMLPVDAQSEVVLTDQGIPCPTDAPAPPVQAAVCGPNNDLVAIPEDQPEGISLASDSDWQDNQRTIQFRVDPEFATDGQTTFVLTDSNVPCTTAVHITLTTSDGGDPTGASWSLYAPQASMLQNTTPYLTGTLDASSEVVFNELLPGTYRFVVEADGYQSLDATFEVTGEEETMSLSYVLEASPIATAEPTTAPTAAAVTGLPNTGSGDQNATAQLAMLLAAGMVLGVGLTLRRKMR